MEQVYMQAPSVIIAHAVDKHWHGHPIDLQMPHMNKCQELRLPHGVVASPVVNAEDDPTLDNVGEKLQCLTPISVNYKIKGRLYGLCNVVKEYFIFPLALVSFEGLLWSGLSTMHHCFNLSKSEMEAQPCP